MHCSAARPTSSASALVRPLSSSTRWKSCGPSPGVTPVHRRRVRVHPLAGRRPRQQLHEHLEVRERRHELLDPHDGDEGLGQRQAHPPVALGLDDGERPGVRDGEVRAADRDLGARGTCGAGARGPPSPSSRGSSVRSVGRVVHARRGRSRGSPTRLRWIAGHEDVRRHVVGELDDELGEVGLEAPRCPPRRGPR